MQIAIISNGAVTKIGDFRSLFPFTVFPESGPTAGWLADNSCKKVNLFKSHDSATEILVPSSPYIEGDWVYTVAVRAKTPEETAADVASKAANVRAARDRALAASDWTQVADAPVDKAEWATYRQALRDLPNAEGWPDVSLPNDPDWVDPFAV
jgi:hypothetical protein